MANKTLLQTPTKTANAYWSVEKDDLLKKFGGTDNGLSSETARQRLAEVGHNSLETKKQDSAPAEMTKRWFFKKYG